MDALEHPRDLPARKKWFDSPGLGYDVRIEGEHLIGEALVVEEHPVHLELFHEGSGAPEAD